MAETSLRGPGGTPGGLGQFLIGLAMAVAGGYLITTHVTVSSGSWTVWGHSAFGLSLVPFLFGVAILFFNGRSILGWLLLFTGVVVILTGIIMNLQIYFQSTTLYSLLTMLVLLFGGLGLLARSFRTHG